ncbi:MAG: CRISPR-associated endonuclease Cas2 [Candidatus Zambryskibacteria bacterium]|nr:CRISPR-associated endonuclease Cas2 [Candidatus Zambryskibacteria bacterium]
MGKLEEINRKRVRKTRIQEAILLAIVSGGRIGSDMLVKQVIDSFLETNFFETSPRKMETVKSAASRLTRKGLVKFENGFYSPTISGEKLWNAWQMSDYQIRKPKKWDGKWRVIIFDIPEKKKKIREQVRKILLNAGFIRLQDSVWVYPYDCEDVIGLMKIDFGIGKNLLYMIVNQIEDDRFLRMDFGLIK